MSDRLKLSLLISWIFIFFLTLTGPFNRFVLANEIEPSPPPNAPIKPDLKFTEKEKQWIIDNPIVRARVGEVPPLHFFEKSPKGISVDYLNLIADRTGFKVKYIPGIPWPKALDHLKNHEKIDLLLTARITEERKKFISFTDNYLIIPWVIFTRTENRFISGIVDLKNETVSVERGYVMHRQLIEQFPDIKLMVVDTSKEAVEAVATGKADAYIGDLTTATYIIQKNNFNNMKIAAPTSFENHNQAMGVRDDWPPLTSIINKTLNSLTPEEHEEIRHRWMAVRYEYGISKLDVIKWTLVFGVCSILIISLVMLWNRRLKKEVIQREESERLLAESEKRYRQMFETNPAVKLIIDPKTGSIIEANHAACEFYGYPKNKITSLKISDINMLPPNQVGEGMGAAKSEDVMHFNFPHKLASGELRDVEVYSGPILYGQSTLLHSIIHDITDRKKAQAALKESEKEFQDLYDNANEMFASVNPETALIIRCNQTLASKLGYTKDEIVNRPVFELYHPDCMDDVKEVFKQFITTGEVRDKELLLQKKEGGKIDVSLNVSTVRNNKGDIISSRSSWYDITERKAFEKDIVSQRDLFELVINSVPTRVFWKDLDLVYLGCNTHFAKDSGMESPQDVIGKNDYALVWNKDAGENRADDKLVISTGKPKLNYEEGFFNNEGKKVWWMTNKMPLRSSDGEIIGIVATSENITNRKNSEDDKHRLEIQLQQAQKMESIGTLAGGIAHDFNNILTSIIGFTELALGGIEKGTELEDDLQEVKKAGARAKDLVKQILTFARKSDEKLKPIQINPTVKEVLKFIKSSIPSTIQINENINSDSFIIGSTTQVHQVLMNLCTNASQAMEETGGVLDVSLEDVTIDGASAHLKLKYGEYIKLTVKDNGKGIPPQDISTIFEPYFTTKPTGEGTGMGLAVVHGIVENYGGKIVVDSTINKGTSFSVYLPISKKRKLESRQEPTLPSGTERILLIDDEALIVKMGARMLGQLGYSVTTRTDSIAALELFKSKPSDFDLVISDMTMPNMTGDALAAELMTVRSDIPIIVFTGYSKNISKDIADAIGIKAFAFKPILKADLAKTVRKVLDEAKSENQR